MPVVFPVSTRIVSIMTRYLGAPNIYIDHNTTWAQPVIDDWSRPPALTFDPDNEWWRRSEELLSAAVEMIETQGYSAFVGLPDLNGPTEVLSGLRNPEKLAMDFYDQPEVIKPAIRKVQDAWFEAYRRSSAITSRSGGYISWLRVWSERPMCDLQSDVSCLISKEMFDQYFLPFIAEQARTIERTIYHLDGPDAVRHLDSLLTIEELDGIQWVPGAGAARMSEWIYLLKRIQDRGKLLHISCDPDEVPLLCRKLDPSRLVLQIHSESEEHADSLVRDAEQASS
jgi:5-methyltetrahydrofolate--homocysteine methyltransferase